MSDINLVERPTGVVTFLFTDVEGSTGLVQQLGDAWGPLLEQQRTIIHAACADHGGFFMGTDGDGCRLAFADPSAAFSAAVSIQRGIASADWPDDGAVRVRVGIHAGSAGIADDDYIGLAVHHAARIADSAHGGQTVLSGSVADLVGRVAPDGSALRSLGAHTIRDVGDVELVQLHVDGMSADFPPPRSAGLRTNVPGQRTSLIGRGAELDELERLVTTERLITVTGAGGVGKTRLALGLAPRLASSFPDGIWLADLAPVAGDERVVEVIADAVDLPTDSNRGSDNRPMMDRLVDHLAPRALCLVIDNCEHVIEGVAAAIDRLGASCPSVHIVATSREPIGVHGETVWRAPSLGADDASSLFDDRARRADAGYTPDAACTAGIVERLDHLPLAIELAAARCRALTPAEIFERLDDRFRLLTGGSRGGLERHQTLQATVDWSFRLLSDDEQCLLTRFAVFAGGATLSAAEEVCGFDPIDPAEVLDVVSSLLDKSLLAAGSAGDATRYRLPETVKQYARARLVDSDDMGTIRDRHADHYASFAAMCNRGVVTAESPRWAAAVVDDHDNFVSAIEWSASGDGQAAVGIAGDLSIPWALTADPVVARSLLETAEPFADDAPDRAAAWLLAGLVLILMNRSDRAWRHLGTSAGREVADLRTLLAAARVRADASRDVDTMAMVRIVEAFFAQDFDDDQSRQDAASAAEQVLELLGDGPDPYRRRPHAWRVMAMAAIEHGDFDRAQHLLERADSVDDMGVYLRVMILEVRAAVAVERGDAEAVDRLLDELVGPSLNRAYNRSQILRVATFGSWYLGRRDDARLYAEAWVAQDSALAVVPEALCDAMAGDVEAAAQHLDEVNRVTSSISSVPSITTLVLAGLVVDVEPERALSICRFTAAHEALLPHAQRLAYEVEAIAHSLLGDDAAARAAAAEVQVGVERSGYPLLPGERPLYERALALL